MVTNGTWASPSIADDYLKRHKLFFLEFEPVRRKVNSIWMLRIVGFNFRVALCPMCECTKHRPLWFIKTSRSTKPSDAATLKAMAFNPDSGLDRLWKEYGLAFRDFDDLTL